MTGLPKASITIDARDFEPPEPFVQTMTALDRLHDEGKLLLLLNREPLPLYRALELNGYTHKTTLHDEGFFQILIWRSSSNDNDSLL